MSTGAELLVALVIAVGLVGTILPVLPGLALAWAAVLVWTIADGGGLVRWSVLAVVSVLMVVGMTAKYVLSGRRMRERGAPRSTLLAAGVGGIVGFFVIPVVGIVVGLAAGSFLAELSRLHDKRAAWSSTWAVLVALGIGTLIELAAGVVMALTWGAGVALT